MLANQAELQSILDDFSGDDGKDTAGDEDEKARMMEQINTMYKMMLSYKSIVLNNLRDLVPKYIVKMLIKNVGDYVGKELLGELILGLTTQYNKRIASTKKIKQVDSNSSTVVSPVESDGDKDTETDDEEVYETSDGVVLGLMDEPPEVVERRKEAQRKYTAMKKALRIIDETLLAA